MSFFNWLGSIFKPASDLVDELHYSGEEEAAAQAKMAELKNKLAEIESKVAVKLLELQSQSIDAQAKIAIAEQQHGNTYTKSVRPTIMLGCFVLILLMAFGYIPMNELILKICGGFMGIYGGLRTYEKKVGKR